MAKVAAHASKSVRRTDPPAITHNALPSCGTLFGIVCRTPIQVFSSSTGTGTTGGISQPPLVPVSSVVSVIWAGAYRHYWEPLTAVYESAKYTAQLLRGTIINRTYGIHKNLYIHLVLLTIFGTIYYGPPQ